MALELDSMLNIGLKGVTGFPGGSDGKDSACNVGDLGSILGWEDPIEEGVATHSSILAWRIPWTEEPGRLYSLWGHKGLKTTEQLTHTHTHTHTHSL